MKKKRPACGPKSAGEILFLLTYAHAHTHTHTHTHTPIPTHTHTPIPIPTHTHLPSSVNYAVFLIGRDRQQKIWIDMKLTVHTRLSGNGHGTAAQKHWTPAAVYATGSDHVH